MSDLLFCALETSGLDPQEHEVIEVYGALIDVRGTMEDSFHVKIHPLGVVDPEAAKVNGYTKEGWADAAYPSEAWPRFNDWLDGRTVQLVNWNPDFDLAFLKPHLERVKVSYHPLDVLSMVWPYVWSAMLPEGRRYVDLRQAHRRCLGVEMTGEHTAWGDVEACLALYRWAIQKGW